MYRKETMSAISISYSYCNNNEQRIWASQQLSICLLGEKKSYSFPQTKAAKTKAKKKTKAAREVSIIKLLVLLNVIWLLSSFSDLEYKAYIFLDLDV